MVSESTYQPRIYRLWSKGSGLISFTATVNETDLYIRARKNLKRKALKAIQKYRGIIEGYIARNPAFFTALEPLPVADDAPQIVREMAWAAARAGVGPMAAVAGAIAERVGRELLPFSPEVMVENGGDLFLNSSQPITVGIYAGQSPFTGRLALEVAPEQTPLGICTSSGSVGHSLSFGSADAVIVLSSSAALADAAATAMGNLVKGDADMARGIELAQGIEGIEGAVIIAGDKLAAWGQVRLAER